jgi:hypothetical protein
MGRALLFLVSGMFIVFGIVQSGVQGRLSSIPERTYDYHAENHAENIVNSAMDYALREIINDQNWEDGYVNNDYMDGSVSIQVYDQSSSDIPSNEIPSWDQYTLLVKGTSEYEDVVAQSEIYLRKDAFSKYSYFTDSEISTNNSSVYFIWSDELSGPVHTNGTFNIAGDPTFNGFVSSPNDWNGYSGMTNDPNFNGGTDFNADYRDPPSNLEMNVLENSASSNGLTFNEEVDLEFLNDGRLKVSKQVQDGWTRNWRGNWVPRYRTVENYVNMTGYNGVISSTEDISIKGTVNGSYTVHSEKNIEISGDIVYNDNPIDNPNSTDLLGIVSEKNVTISEDAHRDNGYSDLTIQASIMALDESFSLDNYNDGSPKGDLNLLGGIIQQKRGPMGTFSGGQVRSGFNKQYEYDERLMRMNPPSFPRESFFSIVHWFTESFDRDYVLNQNLNEED